MVPTLVSKQEGEGQAGREQAGRSQVLRGVDDGQKQLQEKRCPCLPAGCMLGAQEGLVRERMTD